jgi:hypothetical protein
MGVRTKPRVDPGFEFQLSAQEPEQVGKPVEVGEDLRVQKRAGFGEAYSETFSTAADCARNVHGRRIGKFARDGPIVEDAGKCLDGVDLSIQRFYHLRRDGRSGFSSAGCGTDSGADGEEFALECFDGVVDLAVGRNGAGEAELGDQLVDGSVAFDTFIGFRNANAPGQVGLAGVAPFGCDTHMARVRGNRRRRRTSNE